MSFTIPRKQPQGSGAERIQVDEDEVLAGRREGGSLILLSAALTLTRWGDKSLPAVTALLPVPDSAQISSRRSWAPSEPQSLQWTWIMRSAAHGDNSRDKACSVSLPTPAGGSDPLLMERMLWSDLRVTSLGSEQTISLIPAGKSRGY